MKNVLCTLGVHKKHMHKSGFKFLAWSQTKCTRCDWKGRILPDYQNQTSQRDQHKGKVQFVHKVKQEFKLP